MTLRKWNRDAVGTSGGLRSLGRLLFGRLGFNRPRTDRRKSIGRTYPGGWWSQATPTILGTCISAASPAARGDGDGPLLGRPAAANQATATSSPDPFSRGEGLYEGGGARWLLPGFLASR